ncbi:hypothetical protein [Hymenobacter amundsenii]|uniref:hypothetical protein n=1 Tax=Hymenobacter amundsenii TaxID=2006685 RepID=UPI000F828DE5|nr:hypothetical protein [Hymenobacter amundsenii]
MRFSFLFTSAFLVVASTLHPAPVAAQRVKSAAFNYLPEVSADRYNQRVARKTLPLAAGGFLILAHQAAGQYAVERYDADLKRQWSTPLPLAAGEVVDGFARSKDQATVVVHQNEAGTQRLVAYTLNLATGQKSPARKLIEANSRDRRPGVAFSPDGTRLVAWRYLTQNNQIKSLSASVYDGQLLKLKNRSYDFQDQGDFFSVTVHIGNDGTQFVTLAGDHMKKLAVRRYLNDSPDVKVMSVSVGGTFGGKEVNIFDSRFVLRPDNTLYAAAICNERATGLYHSLKLVKFDFAGEGDLKLATEMLFSPEYLAQTNQATGAKATRLDDIYLTDLLLTDAQQVVVMAEKKFEEGGEGSPGHTRELHVFGYNEFLRPDWHGIVAKDQVAPAAEGYSAIGYQAATFGSDVELVTWEKINGKSDLYLRRISVPTGVVSEPKALGLSVAADQNPAYVKDFTAWLDAKTIIGVSRPSKKSAALMLNKIVLK